MTPNDLYTRPGPGAYELEPWDGTERRGKLADLQCDFRMYDPKAWFAERRG